MVERAGGPSVAGLQMTIADHMIAQPFLQIRAGAFDGIRAAHVAASPRQNALADAYLDDSRHRLAWSHHVRVWVSDTEDLVVIAAY